MKKSILVLCISLISANFICAQIKQNTAYQIISTSGMEVPEDAYIKFIGNKISGFSLCNNFTGNCKITEGTISINNLASTKMACTKDGLNLLETNLIQSLEQVNSVRAEADKLILGYGKKDLIVIKEKVEKAGANENTQNNEQVIKKKSYTLVKAKNLPQDYLQNMLGLTFICDRIEGGATDENNSIRLIIMDAEKHIAMAYTTCSKAVIEFMSDHSKRIAFSNLLDYSKKENCISPDVDSLCFKKLDETMSFTYVNGELTFYNGANEVLHFYAEQ